MPDSWNIGAAYAMSLIHQIIFVRFVAIMYIWFHTMQ